MPGDPPVEVEGEVQRIIPNPSGSIPVAREAEWHHGKSVGRARSSQG